MQTATACMPFGASAHGLHSAAALLAPLPAVVVDAEEEERPSFLLAPASECPAQMLAKDGLQPLATEAVWLGVRREVGRGQH